MTMPYSGNEHDDGRCIHSLLAPSTLAEKGGLVSCTTQAETIRYKGLSRARFHSIVSVTAWKFHCDTSTRDECLDRRLFGGTSRVGNHDVELGDTVFLHDFERGLFFGPFVSESTGLETIDPNAWDDHPRSFPKQIHVSYDEEDIYNRTGY